MKYVWAPWRMAYIVDANKPAGCIFCQKIAEDRDRENAILWRGRHAFVILNAYPYNPGHLMVVPYAHVAGVTQLETEALVEVMELTRRSVSLLDRAMGPEGVNIGINQGAAAGAGITDHIHQHVVPRWIGDTNFMTSIGETKVLPEMIDDTYHKLAPLFQES